MKRRIKVGDSVYVVTPKFVKRVGYPLIASDLEAELSQDSKVQESARMLGLLDHKPFAEFLRGVCRAMVIVRGFGGRHRTIHYEPPSEIPEFDVRPDEKLEVHSIRIVKTGTYVVGDEGFPAYLDNIKTHRLVHTSYGWIEECNVKLADT